MAALREMQSRRQSSSVKLLLEHLDQRGFNGAEPVETVEAEAIHPKNFVLASCQRRYAQFDWSTKGLYEPDILLQELEQLFYRATTRNAKKVTYLFQYIGKRGVKSPSSNEIISVSDYGRWAYNVPKTREGPQLKYLRQEIITFIRRQRPDMRIELGDLSEVQLIASTGLNSGGQELHQDQPTGDHHRNLGTCPLNFLFTPMTKSSLRLPARSPTANKEFKDNPEQLNQPFNRLKLPRGWLTVGRGDYKHGGDSVVGDYNLRLHWFYVPAETPKFNLNSTFATDLQTLSSE